MRCVVAMVMMHKVKAKKIVQGRFGRKKTVEVDVYVPSTYTHISKMAGHAAGVSDGEAAYATHTLASWRRKKIHTCW